MATATYYFDASDAGPSDPNNVWSEEALAFDGNGATHASSSNLWTDGSASVNYLGGVGTNAPATGGTISAVRARVYMGDSGAGCVFGTTIYFSGAQIGALTHESPSLAPSWTPYVELSAPDGGWAWDKVQALEVRYYKISGAARWVEVSYGEIEVTYEDAPSALDLPAASSDGTSTVSGALSRAGGVLAGTSAGESTVTGALSAYTPPEAEEPEPTYPAIVEYQLRLRKADGTLVAVLTGDAHGGSPTLGGFLSCTYRKVVNAPGMLAFVLDADSEAAALVENNGIVELWRRDNGNELPWARDFTGIVRRRLWRTRDQHTLTVYCPGPSYLLSKRHVLWPAGTTNRSMFLNDPAETIAKTLVAYNAGADATVANGRLYDGAITGLSVEADAAGGNTLDWYCAYDNLLATLQDLAKVGGGDFDTVQTDDAAFEFRWYDGQLGTDRSATVIFALEWGNMAEPEYEDDRLDERNIVAALGQGEGAARTVTIRTTGDEDSEGTTDARNEATEAGLEAVADMRLAQWQRRQSFTFRALQTPSCLYGKHYFLGDLVTARYGGVYSATRKVVAVDVSVAEDGTQTITPEFGAP